MPKAIARARAMVCCALLTSTTVVGLSSGAPQNLAFELPSNRQVLAFLLQSIDWYRHEYAERQTATDPTGLLFQDDNHAIEAQIVRFSFDFARADAALISVASPFSSQARGAAPAGPSSSDLARFIMLRNRTDGDNQKTDMEIEALKGRLFGARGADRAKLQANLEEAQSRSELLQAASKTINDLVEFAQSVEAGQGHTGDLESNIDDLAQTVPEVNTTITPAARSPLQDATSNGVSNAHDGGIMTLWSEVSAEKRELRAIEEKVHLTDNLIQSAQNIRDPMAKFISQLVQKSDVSSLWTGDLALLKRDKMQLDALTVELKSLAPVIVALDKQKVLLVVYKSHLADRRNTVADGYQQAWKKVLFRLLLVVLIMLLLVGVSEVSRRIAERHVQDPDRSRRIIFAHRLLTLAAILIVAAVGFASDLRSFVTYFGLLTAGIAVALQNVIVASVGYLLLVGKRGIRVGDRVRISGISGDVLDIGLLQFQLREIDLETKLFTGHVATFSNSLVFVSPAIGLVKFSPQDEHKFRPEGNHADPLAHPRERRVSAPAEIKRNG
jgi:Mechanosensitive ion channel